MHLLIDLQGAQTESRKRGIGRYALALTKALIRKAGGHRVTILLNGFFAETVPIIKAELAPLLPQENILIFSVPGPLKGKERENGWRARAAELIREHMVVELAPDFVLLTSLFEGPIGDAVTSVGLLPWSGKTAVVLYDLIPYSDPTQHLGSPFLQIWYYTKIQYLQSADLLLAISDFARAEAIQILNVSSCKVSTIYSAADESFADLRAGGDTTSTLARFGITRKFVMFASAFDPRKNFQGLVRAFGRLPETLRDEHQLVLVTKMWPTEAEDLRALAKMVGLRESDLVLTGYVDDFDLVTLYSHCALFVFPSFQEGFGLPALEAMRCGAVTIGSSATSVPEVIGRQDALFDPYSDEEMAGLMIKALVDESFRRDLKAHAREQAAQFNWNRSASLAWEAMELRVGEPAPLTVTEGALSSLFNRLVQLEGGAPVSEEDLIELALCIETNEVLVKQYKLNIFAAVNSEMTVAR